MTWNEDRCNGNKTKLPLEMTFWIISHNKMQIPNNPVLPSKPTVNRTFTERGKQRHNV